MPGSITTEDNSKQPELFSDIIVEILLKLPVKTLSKLNCVCKSWFSLFSSSWFKEEYYYRGTQQNPLLLITEKCGMISGKSFLNFTISDNNNVTKFSKSVPYTGLFFIPQSCGGLVCLRSMWPPNMLLLNPSTEEIIFLLHVRSRNSGCIGFGFAASTQKFKVVWFSRGNTREGTHCEIFTLGTNYWRETRNPPPFADMETAPFVHGSFHLLPLLNSDSQDKHISAFNVETENYSEILLPANYNHSMDVHGTGKDYFCKFSLTELGGSLCLTLVYPTKLELWILKDYSNEEWIKEYTIKVSSLAGHFSQNYDIVPLVIMGDGSIMLHIYGSRTTLLRYNPEHKVATYIKSFRLNLDTMTYFVESFFPLEKMYNMSAS